MNKKIRVTTVANYVLMIAISLLFLIPFWVVLTASFTDEITFNLTGYSLGIKKFSLAAYKFLLLRESTFLRSIFNSVLVTMLTVLLSMAVNVLTAYALSRKSMPGHKALNVFFVFTMFFNGGMVPTFLVVKGVGLFDTIWALILPQALGVYNVLLIRNYFYSIPASMEEAAVIDGAKSIQVLCKILIPVSKPIILTTALMTAVTKWNSWMDVLLYLSYSSKHLWTMQYMVRQILTDIEGLVGSTGEILPTQTVQSAAIIVSVVPLLLVFPFVQRFFRDGLTMGAVKG